MLAEMAHPHPVVSFPPLSGSPTMQSIRTDPFPNLTFTECANEPPLDLNFVQKFTQGSLNMQHDSEVDTSLQHHQMELDVSSGLHQELVMKMMPESAALNGVLDCPPSTKSDTKRSRCHWTHGEVMALFDAKKAQADKYDSSNEKLTKKARTLGWDEVAEHCKNVGVTKLASQCKDKWERIWPQFRKILDWERQLPPGRTSYWSMLGDEREQDGFPRVFDKELYDAMADRFGYVRTFDLAAIIVDSSLDDPDIAAMNNCSDPAQDGADIFEDAPSVVDDQTTVSSGRKRKGAARLAHSPSKPNENKTNFDSKQENGPSKVLKEKGMSVELSDRKLSLEEKKLDLAEKRLVLEEKKLEVTIEIGRGLITSMERMTGAISGIGVFSAPTSSKSF